MVEGGWPVLYNFTVRGVTSVIKRNMGKGVLKNWHFLLYNMWTVPYSLDVAEGPRNVR